MDLREYFKNAKGLIPGEPSDVASHIRFRG